MHGQRAGEQDEEARSRLTLGVDLLAGQPGLAVPVLTEPVQLIIIQRLEQEQRAQLGWAQPHRLDDRFAVTTATSQRHH